MSEDPRITTMRLQLEKLGTRMARANADYLQAQETGDDDTACMAAQEYANADQERVNLLNTAQRIAYSEQANVPRQKTREEVIAAPLEALSPQERREWIRSTTKHGLDDDWYSAGEVYVANNPSKGR